MAFLIIGANLGCAPEDGTTRYPLKGKIEGLDILDRELLVAHEASCSEAEVDDVSAATSGLPSLVTSYVRLRRTALTFGDRPVEYRVSTIDTRHHDYVHLLSRPTSRHE